MPNRKSIYCDRMSTRLSKISLHYIFSQNIGDLYIKSIALDRKFKSTFYNGRIYIYLPFIRRLDKFLKACVTHTMPTVHMYGFLHQL